MKIPLLFIKVCFTLIAQGQQIQIKGSIVDSVSNDPIPSVTVSVIAKRLFYPADDNGKFIVVSREIAGKDSLAFSCIGYQTKRIRVSETPSKITVKLSPLVNMLQEVTVKNRSSLLIKAGSKEKNSNQMIWQHPGMDRAQFMIGSKNVKGVIKTIGFFLSNGHGWARGGDVNAPFRIRLFEVDTAGKPGKEITKDIIIVSAKKNRTWFDVDLSAYHMQNPDGGFYASFSLLDVEYYKLKKGANTTDAEGNKWETIDNRGLRHDEGAGNPADIIDPRLGITLAKQKNSYAYFSTTTLEDMSWHWEPERYNWEYMIRATIAAE